MRKLGSISAVIATIAIMAATAAVAQEPDPSGITSLDPLTRIVEGFSSGAEADALYLQSETDTGPTGLRQFQLIINMGGGAAFGEQDVELVPSGLSDDGNLVSLEDQFGGTLGGTSQIPPFAPFARGQAMDLTAVFEGWTAYGEDGLIEGPVEILEGMQAFAGIELSEPYDPDCTELSYIGRAWVGSTVSAPDPLFTAEALSGRYSGTDHDALAGRASRMIELVCFPGSGSRVSSFRMKEDSGIRPFGPLGSLALVKGNHVVLVAPIRVLDGDLTQRFYASPPDGGDIIMTEVDALPQLLLPNPYSPGDVAISITMDAPTRDGDLGEDEGAAPAPGQTQNLLYRPGSEHDILAGTGGGCFPSAVDLILLAATRPQDDGTFFARTHSTAGNGVLSESGEGGQWEITFDNISGSSETITINQNDQTVDVAIGPAGATCTGTGTYTTTGGTLFDGDGVGSDSGDNGSDSDDSDSGDGETAGESDGGTDTGDTDDGGTGGVPWVPIGIAIILLGAAAATAVNRRRTGIGNCEPEKQAFSAAADAYDKAKKAADYYTGEYNHFNSEYNDLRLATENRLDAPDRVRGYPEGPDGDKAYADAKADWDSQEAEAQRAERNLDGTRENMEDAKASMDEAIKAQDTAADLMKQARAALMACQGSAPDSPGDTESPPPSPGGGEAPPTAPGTITDPTDTEDEPERNCPEGETKKKTVSRHEFRVLSGPIKFNIGISDWTAAYPGGIKAEDLADLSESDLRDFFADMGRWNETKTISADIPTDTLTVECVQQLVCSNDAWEKRGDPKRVEQRTPASPIRISIRSKDPGKGVELVGLVNSKVEELSAEAERATESTCN